MPYRDPEKKRACDMAFRSTHKDEIRAYDAAYYAEHREELLTRQLARNVGHTKRIQALRATLTCDVCGGTVDLFHHVDPSTKRFNIGRGFGYTQENVEIELAKCIPMCKPCHTRLHFTRGQ